MTSTTKIMYPSRSYIDLLEPALTGNVCIEDLVWSLSMQCRFGGCCKCFYSIAEHSLFVSDLLAPQGLGYEGLMHDVHEGVTQDLITGLKAAVPELKALEQRWAASIRAKFDLPEHMPPEVRQADLIALATERRDLDLSDNYKWITLRDISPTAYNLEFRSRQEARSQFLHRYHNYREKR